MPQYKDLNFWSHKLKLNNNWYSGETGIPPLDDAIIESRDLAYSHHINRLMVISNEIGHAKELVHIRITSLLNRFAWGALYHDAAEYKHEFNGFGEFAVTVFVGFVSRPVDLDGVRGAFGIV